MHGVYMSDLHITQVNLCFTGFFQNTLCSAFTITSPVLHTCLLSIYMLLLPGQMGKAQKPTKISALSDGSIVQKSTFTWS